MKQISSLALLFVVSILLLFACTADEKTFDPSMIPETTTIPLEIDTTLEAYLGLSEKQMVTYDSLRVRVARMTEDIMYAELNDRKRMFDEANQTHDNELFRMLDKKQREKYLDFRAYDKLKKEQKRNRKSPTNQGQ